MQDFLLKTIRGRPKISLSVFIVIFIVGNILLFHSPLYHFATENLDLPSRGGLQTFVVLWVVVFMISGIFVYLLAIVLPFLVKPLCIVLILINSIALYFMTNYSVILDKTMMSNVFNTKAEESFEFFHINFFLFVLVWGGIPALALSRIRVLRTGRLKLAAHLLVVVCTGLLVIFTNGSTWLWFDKHSKQLGGNILPWSYLINTARHHAEGQKSKKVLTMLPDATLADSDKMLVVLIIGETARANNFSLYDYARETNPKLKSLDLAVLPDVQACSTYTTASLHCMLSHNGKKSGDHEALPSYLQRIGVDVFWRTNNWGEPPLIVGSYQKASELRKNCKGSLCQFDDVLLTGLEEQIADSKQSKIFVALHTKGSHGPSYHTRYPIQFELFRPVCRSVELDQCSQDSLVNAYDNTIVYTDDFIYRTIERLKKIDGLPSVLIYVSDHGESLGEYGLYLHGTPFSIAPDVQKDIPFLVWMSDPFKSARELNTDSIEKSGPYGQENVFHSVLGAFNIESEVYRDELDIFNP